MLTEKKRSRVFLVDDHPVVREGLAIVLGQAGELLVCGMAADAAEAMAAIQMETPDVIVADLALPGLGGIEFIKQLKTRHPEIPVLVLSMHDENIYAERVLRAGAKGYLMKQEASAKVVAAVRQVLAGEIFVSEAVKGKILLGLSKGAGGKNGFSEEQLTDRELEVYQWIGRGRGTRQIAETLHLSKKTVETHCANIKKKLRLSSSPQLMSSAVRWMQEQNVA